VRKHPLHHLLNRQPLEDNRAHHDGVRHRHRSSDIADALGLKINSLGSVRANLIQKGMIFSPAHGDMAFTVPLFDEFMLRAMPQLV
jgi:hypothetical protein